MPPVTSSTPYLSLTVPYTAELGWAQFIQSDLSLIDSKMSALAVSIATAQGIGVSVGGNTSGTLAFISSGTFLLAGGNNVTLSQVGESITISGGDFTKTVAINGSTGGILIFGGSNVTLSQNASSITINAASFSQSVQTQNSVGINGSTGSISVFGGNNITLSQNASSITISGPNTTPQSIQTQSTVAVNGSTGNISLVAGANINLNQNLSTITISAAAQTVQTQNLVDVTLSGNTLGVMSLISSGTMTMAGGNNITLSQNGNAVTIIGGAGAGGGVAIVASNSTYTTGTVVLSGGNNITVGVNGSTITFSAPNQSLQPEMPIGVSTIGNTVGSTGVMTGQLVLAGGNNITLSQSTVAGQSATVTISAANQSVQTQGSVLINGSSGSIVFTAGANISLSQNASTITISASNAPAQTNQTIGVYASSQTVGQSSSSTVDARSFTHVGQGIVSVGMSGGSLLISATTAQSVQTVGVYASSQTVGQSSSSTVDARSITLVGQGAASIGMSGGSILISVVPGGQSNQTIGVYASSQTVGQSSSSTIDARSFTHVGQGIISVGMSGGSLLISATTVAQSVQTQNMVSVNGSTGNISLVAGANISLSQNASTITISASNAPAQTNQTLSVAMTGNTTGNTSGMSVDARSLTLQGLGAASVGLSTSAGGSSVILSVPVQSVQPEGTITAGISNLGNTLGTSGVVSGTGIQLVLAGGNNVTLSQSINGSSATITVSAANQSVQTQNVVDVSLSGNTAGVLALISSGTLILAGGNNITISQNAQSITISGANIGGAQTGISGIVVSNTTYTSGTISFSNANGISFGSSAGQAITASYTVPTQSNQTLSFAMTGNTTGNTTGMSVDARSLTVQGLGAASVGLSTSAGGSSLIISIAAGGQSNQTIGVYASSQTVGQSSSSTVDARSFTHVGQGIVSVGMSGGSLLISATTAQSIQTQNSVLVNGSSGAISISGGNNITVGNNAGTITISGVNTVAQTVQTLGIYASSQTVGQSSSSTIDARSFTHVGQGMISVGMSGGSLLISATQSVQPEGTNTLGISNLGNTSGTSGVISGTGVQLILVGGNNVTLSQSINGSSATITISVPNTAAQSNQSLGIYASSQTVGQSSSSTVDAQSFSIVGAGGVSVGLSGGSLLISGGAGTQSAQTIGVYASSQTVGQSSSSTVDARSFTHVGQGIVSVGMSGGSLLISATTAQSVQTQNLVDVSLSGNTAGVIALVSSGTLILAGGNNITVSQNGQSVTISGPNAGGAQTGISGIIVSNTTYTSGTVSFSNANGISFGSSAGQAITASYTVPTQSVQTVGIYASSQTFGQSSSSTVDARSLSVVGSGGVSVGMSGGSLLISGGAGGGGVAIAASNTTYTSGTVVFGNANGFTWGTNAQTVTLSISQDVGAIVPLGNTTGTTASLTSGTVGLAGGLNITISQSSGTASTNLTIVGPSISTAQLFISGNTSGATAALSSGSIVFAGGNNVTLSQNANTVTISAGAGGFPIVINSSAGGATSGTTASISSGTLSLIAGNNITLSQSNTTALIILGAGQLSVGISTNGNTSGNTGLQADDDLLVFIGGNNVTLSGSTNASSMSITISAANEAPIGISTGGNTAGSTGLNTGQVLFVGGNNITLSQSTVAGQSATITIQAPNLGTAAAAVGMGISTGGNTLGTSGTVSASLVFVGGNNITLSGSTAAGGVATITISAAPGFTGLSTQNRQLGASTTIVPGQSSMWVAPFRINNSISGSSIMIPMTFTGSVTSNVTHTVGQTLNFGLFTASESNQTSFGRLWSTSVGLTLWNSGTASVSYAFGTLTSSSAGSNLMTASIYGLRILTFTIGSILSPGLYAFAEIFISSSAGGSSILRTACPLVDAPSNAGGGFMGAATTSSIGFVDAGVWTAQSVSIPASFALTDIKQSNNLVPYCRIGAI